MDWDFCYLVTNEIYQFLMALLSAGAYFYLDRKSTRLNSSHRQ